MWALRGMATLHMYKVRFKIGRKEIASATCRRHEVRRGLAKGPDPVRRWREVRSNKATKTQHERGEQRVVLPVPVAVSELMHPHHLFLAH